MSKALILVVCLMMVGCSDNDDDTILEFSISEKGGILGQSASEALIVDQVTFLKFKELEGNILDTAVLSELEKKLPNRPDGMTYIVTVMDGEEDTLEYHLSEEQLTNVQLDFIDDLMSELRK